MFEASVVIPTFNRANVLADAIQSVIDQSCPQIGEIIIVDDGSTDGTSDVVRHFNDSRIRFIQHSKNAGVAAARNTGIAASHGDLISFLDSDDTWEKDKLAREVAFLAMHPEADAVFVDVKYEGRGFVTPSMARNYPGFRKFVNGVDARDGVLIPRRTMYLCMLHEMPIKIQATTFRRSALAKFVFDETWKSGEDWELLLRFARSQQIGFIDSPLVRQRYSTDSTYERYQKADALFLTRLFLQEKSASSGDPEAARALREIIGTKSETLGNKLREEGELISSARAYLRGFFESGRLWLLLKTAALIIPQGIRPQIRALVRQRSSHANHGVLPSVP